MKTLIAVPSKDRVETLKKYTFSWLCLITEIDYKIFVEPQDFEKYKETGIPEEKLFNIGQDNQGLAYSKSQIVNYSKENGYDLVFKVDDDIRCFTDFRKSTTPEKTAELLTNFIKYVEPKFEESNLGGITFPYSFEMFEQIAWEKTKRMQTCYLIRTDLLVPSVQGISVFEDFAVGLNALTKGFLLLRYGLLGQNMGVKVGGGTGGHQSFDRSEKAKQEVELLRKIYPPLDFRRVNKPWKIEPDLRSVKL